MVQAVTLRQLNIQQWQILNVLRRFSMQLKEFIEPFVGIALFQIRSIQVKNVMIPTVVKYIVITKAC